MKSILCLSVMLATAVIAVKAQPAMAEESVRELWKTVGMKPEAQFLNTDGRNWLNTASDGHRQEWVRTDSTMAYIELSAKNDSRCKFRLYDTHCRYKGANDAMFNRYCDGKWIR